MMKKLLSLLALALVCGTLSAQDLIVRRDARTIECKVLRVGGSQVQYTPTGTGAALSSATLPTSEVLLIRYADGREESFPEAAPRKPRTPRFRDSYPHYQGDIAVGYGLGIGSLADELDTDRIVVETVHGVRISPYAFLGLGGGFNYFHSLGDATGSGGSSNGGTVTAFANAKGYYPITGGTSVYLSLDLGGAFGVMNLTDNSKEMYASVGPGVSLGKPSSRQRFDVGIRYQYMGENTGAVLFRIGYEF